jgi:alpha-mannosidase
MFRRSGSQDYIPKRLRLAFKKKTVNSKMNVIKLIGSTSDDLSRSVMMLRAYQEMQITAIWIKFGVSLKLFELLVVRGLHGAR